MTATYAPLLSRSLEAFEADPTSRSRAHLAEYSFRFEPDAPHAAVPRPVEGEPWTLAQTLQELRVRDLEVARSTRGPRVRHGWRVPAVTAAVAEHERAVTEWLRLGRPAPLHGWDDATALWVAWLATSSPSTPLELSPGVTVTDWGRFAGSVAGRYQAGPGVAGADALRRDLEVLFGRHVLAPRRVRSTRRRSRAA